MFLAIFKRKVIDVEASAGPPLVVEVSHEELVNTHLEHDISQLVRSKNKGLLIDYYEVVLDVNFLPTLSKISEVSGPRLAAPARELISFENAAGDPVGSGLAE